MILEIYNFIQSIFNNYIIPTLSILMLISMCLIIWKADKKVFIINVFAFALMALICYIGVSFFTNLPDDLFTKKYDTLKEKLESMDFVCDKNTCTKSRSGQEWDEDYPDYTIEVNLSKKQIYAYNGYASLLVDKNGDYTLYYTEFTEGEIIDISVDSNEANSAEWYIIDDLLKIIKDKTDFELYNMPAYWYQDEYK